jgi:cytochrome c oxidase assembly protein subunit 15
LSKGLPAVEACLLFAALLLMSAPSTQLRNSTYQAGLSIFAASAAAWVFVLVTLGAFTTTIGAGMAFPDWPLSNGSVNPEGWLTDVAMFAEHSHRLSGTTMGLLAIGLAFWLHRTVERRWLRVLGWWALGIVVIQGLIGGKRVLLDATQVPGFDMSLGQMLRVPHGVLAQVYVCLLVAIALGCSRGWIERALPVGPKVRSAAVACVALLLVQLTVAAFMRHNHAGLAIPTFPFSSADHAILPPHWDYRVALQFAHRVMALVLAVAIPILWVRVRRDPGATPALRGAATVLLVLLVVQILLGASVIWSLRRPDLTTAHVIVGAITLATAFGLACLAHRDAIESKSTRP